MLGFAVVRMLMLYGLGDVPPPLPGVMRVARMVGEAAVFMLTLTGVGFPIWGEV